MHNLRKFSYVFKALNNILSDKLKIIVYKALMQSIISYGIVLWSSDFKTLVIKLKTTLNSLST